MCPQGVGVPQGVDVPQGLDIPWGVKMPHLSTAVNTELNKQ